MPLTRNLLNEEINTIETDNNEKIEDVWFKSLIVKILLFVLGALLLLSIVLILIATALTHTAWFHRRKRSYYKRLDSSNKSKLCMKDYIVHYFCIIVETLAINSLDDNEAHSKHTKLFTPKQNEKTQETTSLPLRFQPEKLYGATTVSTKDKIRKGSCIDLPPYPQENRCRKKSMLDNFVFADQRRGSKVLDSTTSSKSNLSIHHSHLAGNEKRFFETGKSGMSAKLEPQDIPLIISDLSNQSFVDQNSSHNTSVSVEDLKSSSPNQKDIRLTVPIITRRASATDYELLDNRAAKSKRLLEAPISITVTDTQSEFDNNSTLKRDNINMRSTSSLLIEDPRIIRRNSFLSYYTVAETKLNDDCEPADDDKSVFSVNSPTSIDKQTKIESSASFTNIMEANKSILLNTDIDQEKNLFKRLPPLIAYEWMQFPAGIMAIGIRYFSKFRSEQGQILVTIYTVKNLLSARLWHKTIFNVHCTISAKDNSQTFIVRSKETEFGCPQFLTNNEVSMNIPLRRCSTTSGTSDIETPKVYIQLKIFESIPKWSGDKEYYHGSCSLSTEELSYGRKEFEYVGWCLVEEAYPIIRLSGDMLISICRNQNKGFVNIRIHEIRNMKFHSYGRWRIENLESLLANRSYEMTIHTCLINAGHIIKSIKAAKFHHYSRRASKFNEMNLNNLTEEKSREIKSNSFTLNDCSVQFSLPSVKKSVGKHLAVKHGITIYVKGKLPIADLIPYECSNQLKQLGITNTRVLHAIGECHFGDYGFQSDLVKDFNRPPSIHSSQGFSLWSDAGSRNGTRVYQWLRIE